jgi:Uma2 family endonuclease
MVATLEPRLKPARATSSTFDFDAFAALPESSDKLLEYIHGEIIEAPSNPYSSKIAARFNGHLGNHIDEQDLEHVTGEQGGYMVHGERYTPDVAVIAKSRQPEVAKTGYNPLPPDLDVEIVSPTDQERLLSIKIGNYLAVGTEVWMVYPDDKEVIVYRPGQAVQRLGPSDTLTGQGLLEGFTLPLAAIFRDTAP